MSTSAISRKNRVIRGLLLTALWLTIGGLIVAPIMLGWQSTQQAANAAQQVRHDRALLEWQKIHPTLGTITRVQRYESSAYVTVTVEYVEIKPDFTDGGVKTAEVGLYPYTFETTEGVHVMVYQRDNDLGERVYQLGSMYDRLDTPWDKVPTTEYIDFVDVMVRLLTQYTVAALAYLAGILALAWGGLRLIGRHNPPEYTY